MLEDEEGGGDDDGGDDQEGDASEQAGSGPAASLVVARIAKVAPHPKADRLKMCKLDVGASAKTVTVVCGAANAAPDVLCILAPVGSKLPGTGVTLTPATIRGVESLGMLCGTAELGWPADGIPDNHLVVLPPGAVPGSPAPTAPQAGAGAAGADDEVCSFASKEGQKKTDRSGALAGGAAAGPAPEAAPEAADAPSGDGGEVFSFAKKGGKKKAAAQEAEAAAEVETPEASGGDGEVFSFAKKGKKKPAAAAADGEDEESAKVLARLASESAARAKFEADRAAAAEKAEKEKQQKRGKPIVTASAAADDDIDAILAALETPSEPKADAGGKKS